MTSIFLFPVGRGVTLRPTRDTPIAVVAVPTGLADPAKDRIYTGTTDRPGHEFSPEGLLIAARAGMFGLRVLEDHAPGAASPAVTTSNARRLGARKA